MEEGVVSVRMQQIMGADRMSSEEETAVPAVCCDSGFLKEEYQPEDDGRMKLVVAGMRYLSIEVRLLSVEATIDSTWFMIGFTRGLGCKCLSVELDHELVLLVLEKRVVKSSQDIEMVSPLQEIQLLVESHADDGDAEEAVTKI